MVAALQQADGEKNTDQNSLQDAVTIIAVVKRDAGLDYSGERLVCGEMFYDWRPHNHTKLLVQKQSGNESGAVM